MNKEAVILVAGMGTRLKPLTLTNHKCLTKVNGKEILFNSLDILCDFGFSHITLVVGYLADTIMEVVGKSYKGVPVSFIYNSVFKKTNTSYSLKLGLEEIKECNEVYVIEGDVFFSRELFEILVRDSHMNATLLEPYRDDLDGTFVELGDSGFVKDWTHKSMREDNYDIKSKYKTINIHKFQRKYIEYTLVPCINRFCEKNNGKDPLENIMREIVRKNNDSIYGVLSKGMKWYEIDDLNDLHLAEQIFGE